MVDGCRSRLVNVVSGVPHGSVLGELLFLLYTSEVFSVLENMLIGYADDCILLSVVSSADILVTVAEFLNSGLGKLSEWCELLGMKLNAIKTKTVIVSKPRTMYPQSPPLIISGNVVK